MGNATGRKRFLEIAEQYAKDADLERDRTQRADELRRKLARDNDPLRKFHARHLNSVNDDLAAIQSRQAGRISEVQELQRDDASVPNDIDELDAGLVSLRVSYHDVREHLKHLQGLTLSSIVGASREQRVRELEAEARGYVEKIRRREAELLATLAGEEQVRG